MNIFCIGRNYVDHINELNNQVPTEPVIFMKPYTSIHNKNKPYSIPTFSDNVQYECEIVLKIAQTIEQGSLNINYKDACSGISIGIDVTARDIQDKLKEKKLPWELAKAFESSIILDKFLNLDQFKNIEHFQFKFFKNKELVQHGNSKLMIYDFNTIIVSLNKYFTLRPNDLIFTGTPAGVGKMNNGDHFEGYFEDSLILDFVTF
ncbi:MAG: fumarylacetoacetate hydrolase family protein [Alphaproteobacteria bacterium]|nr:fumarylacetoacetate hydrolase family protein [Alphaproteobacteria bacterium]